jgi:2-phospho-L-lactate guanylyltransferase
MPTVIVPFRGVGGKSRLDAPSPALRAAVVEAMLADVLDACLAVGPTFLVTPDTGFHAEATVVPDSGGGLAAAVRMGLAAAVAAGEPTPLLVVNADLPCVTPNDLLALAGAVPTDGLALVPARDGTTNALALAAADLFAPVYGAGSAARFAALAPSVTVNLPNLVDDVDTVADLDRVRRRLGPSTRNAVALLRAEAA